MLTDVKKHISTRVMATAFHNTMAEIVVKTVQKLSKIHRIDTVALSGGVFQNQFLHRRIMQALHRTKVRIFTNISVPVNDLNISLGQYYVSCHTRKS